jgi:hypothetical protein
MIQEDLHIFAFYKFRENFLQKSQFVLEIFKNNSYLAFLLE